MRHSLFFLFSALLLSLFPSATLSGQPLLAGPMAGKLQARSAQIWTQTRQPARVSCQCQALSPQPDSLPSLSLQARPEQDYLLKFSLQGLRPATEYRCQLRIDGQADSIYQTRFRTLPEGQQAFDFRMAVGSCAYLNDEQSPSDQRWLKFGGRTEIFAEVARREPDFMFWLGDNIYLRDGDWNSREGIYDRYRHTRWHPAVQPLLRVGSHLAIWDDHDFGPNDSEANWGGQALTLEAFQDHWLNPEPVAEGIYTSYRIGDVECFLMDDRSFRSSQEMEDGPGKDLLGPAQLGWLIQSLKASDAAFKIVAIGSQVLSNSLVGEGYAFDYRYELDSLLRRLVAERIEGVVFLSGDKHYTEISRYDPEGFYPILELTVSPLTSFPTFPRLRNTRRVAHTLLRRRNFGLLDFVGEGDSRRMVINIYDFRGRQQWRRVIRAKDLKLK
jgi:alkaline phosphatase D